MVLVIWKNDKITIKWKKFYENTHEEKYISKPIWIGSVRLRIWVVELEKMEEIGCKIWGKSDGKLR